LIKSKCHNCGYEESPYNFFGVICRKGHEGDMVYVYMQCPICDNSILVNHFSLKGVTDVVSNPKLVGMSYPEKVCPKKNEVKEATEVSDFANKKLEVLRSEFKHSINNPKSMVV
jgi:hypothetical protein